MKKWTLPLALATVVVYLTLSVSAAACLFTHQAQPRSTHHHSNSSGATHSLLCAWACQANQPVDSPSAAPDSQPLALAALFLLVRSIRPSLCLTALAQSRAPPRF